MTNATTGDPTVELDVDVVRSQFPAFTDPDPAAGHPEGWVHLENAGGSYLPRQVVDRYHRYLSGLRVQPGAPAGPAQAAAEAMAEARRLVPATFNAEPGTVGEGDVHIGPSTSQNTHVLAQAFRSLLRTGDEVIVTNQDHEANIGAWRRLAATGITIREWSVDPTTGLLDPADLEAILGPRTRLVCMTHASNLAATVNPIRRVADAAHRVGARLVVDGVSWAPHGVVDVVDLDCDVYLYSAYKTYGPHQGLMWTRAGLAEELGNQGHWFNAANPSARVSPAGPDHASVAALAGMVHYYEELHRHHFGPSAGSPDVAGSTAERIARVFGLFEAHEERLMAPLLTFLADRGLRIVGSTSTSRGVRAPTVAFDPGPVGGAAVVESLARAGIGVGHGDFYARRLCDAVGLPDGVVRISAVHYNTVAELERTVEALDRIL